MATGATRSELRKVRAIVSFIGEENLESLVQKNYSFLRGLHVYSSKNEDNELSLSIWSGPKEIDSSRCLFADRISVSAFKAAVDYWKPKYPSPSSL